MDISTTVAGIKFESCIWNASGCWCTTAEELTKLIESGVGGIVSKSSTVELRQGNPEPRLYINDPYGSINSMGVPNKGFKFYTDFGNTVTTKPFIQSILPFSHDDLKQMVLYMNENITEHKLVELNLSCPNLIKKCIVAYDYQLFEEYLSILDGVKSDKLIFGIKLPPYYHDHEFDAVSKLVLRYPVIKFVTCINSVVNGLLIDVENEETAIYPKEGLGGIGGVYCKPTALANVHQFYKRIGDKVDIIGCGGVSTAMDVFEHILAGATAVQVGTLLMKKGPGVFYGLNRQLSSIMVIKEYNKLTDFKGKLKVKKTTETHVQPL